MRVLALAALSLAPLLAQAQQMVLTFSGTVVTYPGAPAGVSDGDALSGRIVFDLSSPSQPYPNPGQFIGYTYYPLLASSARITMGSLTIDRWPGQLFALVRDNVDLGLPHGVRDSFEIINSSFYGSDQFLLGNLIYPSSTLASDGLPSADIPGPFAFTYGLGGFPHTVQGSGNTLHVAVVPEPAALALWLAGLGAIGWRRYRTSLA